MENNLNIKFPPLRGRVLELTAGGGNILQVELLAKALGSEKRMEILRYLGDHTCSLMEIADTLHMPQSTAALHINILENAGLVKTDLQPAMRGLQKMCARLFDRIEIQLPAKQSVEGQIDEISMPIGAYTRADVVPTCGLIGEIGIIGLMDDPRSFFEPERFYAQLIWFRKGYLEYQFPNRLSTSAVLESLEICFESCSEAPFYQLDWPSDITVWVEDCEIGTWTCPSDFGGERGSLTPAWWDLHNTQYGLIKTWRVTTSGSFLDGVRCSNLNLSDLNLTGKGLIHVKIGVKSDANNVGGMNLFGDKFGNYPQSIILRQRFKN